MDTVLGLLEMLAWIGVVIGLAMTITWAVVRLTPGEKRAKPSEESGKPE